MDRASVVFLRAPISLDSRESVCVGGGGVWVGVCLCANEIRITTGDLDLVFYNFTTNLLLSYIRHCGHVVSFDFNP